MAHHSRSRACRSFPWIPLVLALAAGLPATQSQYAPSSTRPWSDTSPRISKAAFSRDGKLGALVYSYGVTLLDLENRREKCLILKEGITALAFTHDAAELAISAKGSYDNSPIGEPAPFVEIQIIDVRAGAVKKNLPDTRVTHVLEMAFTSAGTLFAVVVNPGPNPAGTSYFRPLGELLLWDVNAGKLTPLLTGNKARKVMRCLAAFAPDGDALVLSLSIGSKEEVNLYSTAAPSVAHRIAGLAALGDYPPGIGARIGPLAISNDGKMLAYGASQFVPRAPTGIHEIVLYDLAKKKVARKIRRFQAGGMSLMFLADGRLAAAPLFPAQARLRAENPPPGGPAQGIQELLAVSIWNLANGKLEKRMDLPGDAVVSLLVSKQNAVVSLAGGAWSIRDLQTSEVKGSIAAVENQCLPAGNALLIQEMRKALQSFTIRRILAVSFFPDRPGELMGANDGGVAYFWDVVTGKELHRNQFAPTATHIAISENGRTVAVAGEDRNSVFILEEDGSDRQIPLADFAHRAAALAATAGGEMVAFGGTDGNLGIWDVKNRVAIRQWKAHRSAVRSMAFSRDGTMLASSADDMTLKLWSVGTGAMAQTLEGHKGKVYAVAFAAGTNALLASGGDDSRIILWDVKAGRIVRRFEGHRGSVRSISFSPDGSILVSGADDGLSVWNVKTGKRVKVLLANSAEWTEGRSATAGKRVGYGSNDITATSIRFSPDGKVVACGGTNNTAMVWDTRTWGRRLFRPIEK